MAIELLKTFPNGVEVKFWKLRSLHYDFETKQATIQASGFLTRAAKLSGATPYCTETFVLDGVFSPANIAAFKEKCYTAIKSVPDWSASTEAEE